MMENLNFSISARTRSSRVAFDPGPFKERRSLDLSEAKLTEEEKLWLGDQIFTKKHTAKELSALFKLKQNTLRRYARAVGKGVKIYAGAGRPPVFDSEALESLKSNLTQKSKGQFARTGVQLQKAMNTAAVATKKRAGASVFGPEVSKSTKLRALKKLKVQSTTKAETSTVARRREEADIRNMVSEAAVMEAFMKDLDPGVILNEDATTYKMGKDNFVQRVYFINGEDADDLGPLRRETTDKDKLGLYIKCMNIISAGEALDFSSVTCCHRWVHRPSSFHHR
jgi:hypothetical protein